MQREAERQGHHRHSQQHLSEGSRAKETSRRRGWSFNRLLLLLPIRTFSVHVLLLDSASRASFMRLMPRSVALLESIGSYFGRSNNWSGLLTTRCSDVAASSDSRVELFQFFRYNVVQCCSPGNQVPMFLRYRRRLVLFGIDNDVDRRLCPMIMTQLISLYSPIVIKGEDSSWARRHPPTDSKNWLWKHLQEARIRDDVDLWRVLSGCVLVDSIRCCW